MLSFVEGLSLAGDRAKQNDDAFGFAEGCYAWVIDGATDLHDRPFSDAASDAAWLAHFANAHLHGSEGDDLNARVAAASAAAARAFAALTQGAPYERWQSPIASLLMLGAASHGVFGVDLGDCRVFTLDADGAVGEAGGAPNAADAETTLAAAQTDSDRPLLQRAATIDTLRRMRADLNRQGAHWTFGLNPDCAAQARFWTLSLQPPAHVLLMTDGFAALVDRYRAYDAAALVRAALDHGLQELGRELRAIERADVGGARHPRFKQSDDATALLMRLT